MQAFDIQTFKAAELEPEFIHSFIHFFIANIRLLHKTRSIVYTLRL